MSQNAFVIEARAEDGIRRAHAWITDTLGITIEQNPDVVLMQYGLLSVADARQVFDRAISAPLSGDAKVLIITADRAYHEAQNALLKLFEEPPAGTHLFLILPNLGGLLPTLRSRVQILTADTVAAAIPEIVQEFVSSTPDKRQTFIKKLTSGKDDQARNENRETALEIVNGLEALAYRGLQKGTQDAARVEFLRELATLRGYLYERSAPIRLALEHLSLVLPKDLV